MKKQDYRLYHTTFISKKFQVSVVIELAFWFLLGYYFAYQNASTIAVGESIGEQENIISMLIKIVLPSVVYLILLGHTQCHIYNFLNKDECSILYKMFPNSYKKFQHNLLYTYMIACSMITLLCILYILMFLPSFMVFAIFEFSLMLPVSAMILYVGVKGKGNFMVWDLITSVLFLWITIAVLAINEMLYSYMVLNSIWALCFFVVCLYITYKVIQKILYHMKGEWKH